MSSTVMQWVCTPFLALRKRIYQQPFSDSPDIGVAMLPSMLDAGGGQSSFSASIHHSLVQFCGTVH